VSKDEPANTWRPSGSETVRAFAMYGCVFEWKPLTVTFIPCFSEFLVHPLRIRPFGGPSSKSHVTGLPRVRIGPLEPNHSAAHGERTVRIELRRERMMGGGRRGPHQQRRNSRDPQPHPSVHVEHNTLVRVREA
jgi:hypothetical protein